MRFNTFFKIKQKIYKFKNRIKNSEMFKVAILVLTILSLGQALNPVTIHKYYKDSYTDESNPCDMACGKGWCDKHCKPNCLDDKFAEDCPEECKDCAWCWKCMLNYDPCLNECTLFGK